MPAGIEALTICNKMPSALNYLSSGAQASAS